MLREQRSDVLVVVDLHGCRGWNLGLSGQRGGRAREQKNQELSHAETPFDQANWRGNDATVGESEPKVKCSYLASVLTASRFARLLVREGSGSRFGGFRGGDGMRDLAIGGRMIDGGFFDPFHT